MKKFLSFPRSGIAKLLLPVIAAATVSSSFAIITIDRDFPVEEAAGGEALTGRDKLAKLVAVYQNDVVLLANPEENYSKKIRETVGTPAIKEKLKGLATAGDAAMNVDSLAAATAALVRQNPTDAPAIMASAIEILAEMPGKSSLDDRYTIGRAAIGALPYDLKQRPDLIASIVGISVRGLKQVATADLVRRLREFAINDGPFGERDYKGGLASAPSNRPGQMADSGPRSGYSLSIDQALVNAGILSPYAAAPEFLVMANNFAGDQLADTFFSGDQGTINQGAVFSPGAAGSAGGSGSSGNQINPEPPPAS